jgi:hypothetical protein
MGLAPAAELNGYPGPPLHVLELAEPLDLSAPLRQRMQKLYNAMEAEAVPVGEMLIANETPLDPTFAERTISPDMLAALPARIGENASAASRYSPPDNGRPSLATATPSVRRASRLPMTSDAPA